MASGVGPPPKTAPTDSACQGSDSTNSFAVGIAYIIADDARPECEVWPARLVGWPGRRDSGAVSPTPDAHVLGPVPSPWRSTRQVASPGRTPTMRNLTLPGESARYSTAARTQGRDRGSPPRAVVCEHSLRSSDRRRSSPLARKAVLSDTRTRRDISRPEAQAQAHPSQRRRGRGRAAQARVARPQPLSAGRRVRPRTSRMAIRLADVMRTAPRHRRTRNRPTAADRPAAQEAGTSTCRGR